MYREQLWKMGQYSGFGTSKEANKRFKSLISKGQTGLGIALDLPTQLGLDSDHPQAEGEVGRTGVAIDSLRDVEILFQDLPLDQVGVIRTTANAIGPIALALFMVVGEKMGYSPKDYTVRLQNDILKEYVARGTYIFPPQPSVKLVVDTIEYCCHYLPHWVPLTICGSHMRNAGGRVKHELGFAFATAMTYIAQSLNRGLKIDDFAPNLTFHFSIQKDFFEEIAKFRAARRIWAKIIQERYTAKKTESSMLRISAYTGGINLTAQQPLNNIVRVALMALAGVLGGVQNLSTSSYDEALSLPSEEAVTIALRTQQIIAYESGVINTVDPLGGSYYIEHLSSMIENDVTAVLQRVEELGGAIPAITSGFFQGEILQGAVEDQRDIESGKQVIVGVNKHRTEEGSKISSFQVDSSVEKDQLENLKCLRKERNNRLVQKCLEGIRIAGERDINLVPSIVEAVKAYSTIGEICGVLRELYGEFNEQVMIV
jgi:methylmalonyl-CoA mutase N-terminal domain/subunit